MLQDVAYGTTILKFHSGEEQRVAHAVLTSKYSHAIFFYKDACEKAGDEPLSDFSLYNILKNIKPSQRRSLAGLDDTAAAAMNGFDKLQEVAKSFKFSGDNLEKGKRYLKTHYQLHCSDESSEIYSHSTSFALSLIQRTKNYVSEVKHRRIFAKIAMIYAVLSLSVKIMF